LFDLPRPSFTFFFRSSPSSILGETLFHLSCQGLSQRHWRTWSGIGGGHQSIPFKKRDKGWVTAKLCVVDRWHLVCDHLSSVFRLQLPRNRKRVFLPGPVPLIGGAYSRLSLLEMLLYKHLQDMSILCSRRKDGPGGPSVFTHGRVQVQCTEQLMSCGESWNLPKPGAILLVHSLPFSHARLGWPGQPC
jgi:hypothetical protein